MLMTIIITKAERMSPQRYLLVITSFCAICDPFNFRNIYQRKETWALRLFCFLSVLKFFTNGYDCIKKNLPLSQLYEIHNASRALHLSNKKWSKIEKRDIQWYSFLRMMRTKSWYRDSRNERQLWFRPSF